VDAQLKNALDLNDNQYTNQFPFEACLVMKHHLAETIHKVFVVHLFFPIILTSGFCLVLIFICHEFSIKLMLAEKKPLELAVCIQYRQTWNFTVALLPNHLLEHASEK
jgi:hypothetical protein